MRLVLVSTIALVMIFSQVCECKRDFRISSKKKKKDFRNGSAPSLSPPQSPPPATPSETSPSGLQPGFYQGKCPNKNVDVEAIIATKVQAEFRINPIILPLILRMLFHDCFVRGCDASILLDGKLTERKAGSNLSVRGYEFIQSLKDAADAECPDVVSCADIIVIAANVLVRLGGGPEIPTQTGRRDGLVSKIEDANKLPSAFLTVSQTIAVFDSSDFTVNELVVLLGCHSVGNASCSFYQRRLYEGTNQFDRQMNSTLREELQKTCPKEGSSSSSTFLDHSPGSSNIVDNQIYGQILQNRAVLPIDQALARDPQTRGRVIELASDRNLFNIELAKALIKLEALGVLADNQGQIRKVCSRIN